MTWWILAIIATIYIVGFLAVFIFHIMFLYLLAD